MKFCLLHFELIIWFLFSLMWIPGMCLSLPIYENCTYSSRPNRWFNFSLKSWLCVSSLDDSLLWTLTAWEGAFQFYEGSVYVFNVNYFWTPKDTWKVPNTTNHQGNANQNYIAPVRICIIKKTTKNKCWPKCREKGTLLHCCWDYKLLHHYGKQYATAKSLQSCPTLCDPMDGSPPGSPVPGILQARTLEWVAISFSNAWKWKVKVKSLSRVRLFATAWTAAYQSPLSMGFSRQEYWSGVPLPSPGKQYRSYWKH